MKASTRRMTLLVTLISVSLVFPAGGLGVAAADDLDQALRDEAMRFRSEMGLETDPSLVDTLARTTPPSETFGIPLTADEEMLLQERARIQNELAPAKTYEETHRQTWGGMWLSYPSSATLDHATTINVAVTDDPAVYEDELLGLMPQGADLELHRVSFTEEILNDFHTTLFAQRDFFKSIGTTLHMASTNVPLNVVDVIVSPLTPAIESAIEGRFPPAMIRVLEGGPAMGDSCTRSNCGPPWRGGLKIYRGTNGCTAGYVAQKYAGTWFYQLWTAGHCGTGTWHLGSATGTTIGTTSVNYFQSNSVDVQAIGIPASAIDDDYLYGTVSCTNCVQTDIASVEALNGDTVGAMVRANGAFTGSSAGTLLATNDSIDYMGEHLTALRRASYSRQPGDSGAPVIRISNIYYGNYNVAAGSHTHFIPIAGTNYAVYTHVGVFKNWTGYSIRTNGD